MKHSTILRTNGPDDSYVDVLTLDDVSYPITSSTPLFIDGVRYMAIRSQIDVLTDGDGSVVSIFTTTTILPNDQS